MSESLRRRSSSRQMLQNLIRVTAQRSQEDAEEVERERRRRARERQREEGGAPWSEPAQHRDPAHSTEFDEDMKPSFLVVEEDEGFSDWTHRLENRHEQEVRDSCRAGERRPLAPQWKPDTEEEKRPEEDEERWEPERRQQQAHPPKPPEKVSSVRKETRTSYSSSVFLPQHASGQPADRTSYLAAGTMKPGGGTCRTDGEEEREEEKQAEENEGDQDEEEPSFTREKKEDIRLKTERRREEQENKMADKRSEDSQDGRTEDESRCAATPRSGAGGGEQPLNCYGPMSPTFKKLLIQFYPDEVNSRVSTDGKCTIVERTESLRKSTSNTRRTSSSPPVAVSRINRKLEQYAHALEVSTKEGRSSCQVLTDLTSPPEPVASKKNLFEAREAWNHIPASVVPSKDVDGLKVGVADLISQWVRGSEDGSRCSSPCKPAESCSGKKYTFVVTGHGKYEKVSVENSYSEDANRPAAGLFCENL